MPRALHLLFGISSLFPLNNKLINRSIEIIAEITNLNTEKSEELFYKSNKNIKVAIVSYLKNMSFSETRKILDENKGFLSRII